MIFIISRVILNEYCQDKIKNENGQLLLTFYFSPQKRVLKIRFTLRRRRLCYSISITTPSRFISPSSVKTLHEFITFRFLSPFFHIFVPSSIHQPHDSSIKRCHRCSSSTCPRAPSSSSRINMHEDHASIRCIEPFHPV